MDALSRRHFLRISLSTSGLVLVNGCGPLPFATQPRVARIGHMWSGSPLGAPQHDAFLAGLRDAGWVERQNLVIDERTFALQSERIPALAAELVALQPATSVAGRVPEWTQ